MKTVTVTTVQEMLIESRGNMTAVAKRLGIERNTVRNVYYGKTPHMVVVDGDKHTYYRAFGGEK